MALVAQFAPAWDGSNRAQLVSAWADDAPGIQVWDDFDRSSIDASLSTVGIDTDGVDLVTLRCRMQICESISAAPRWLEPFGKVTGVLGKQPRFLFEPYSITSGDNRNHQTWVSTQFPHYSYDAVTWYPFGSKAYLTTLRARHTEPFTQDTVYVARSWPRPLTVIGQQIEALAAAHPDKIFPTPSAMSFTPVNTTGFPAQSFIADECNTATDERGRAVPHTPLYAFEINDTNFAGPKKDAHYISANHAGEDVGEVVFWEMINYIVGSSDPEAVLIRQKYRIFVYPCANPVGRYAGYWRGAPGSNADPNRNWTNPTPPFDSITKMRNIVVSDHAGRRLYWCFDSHATAWNERMQTTPKTDFPSTVAWDAYARARYPAGQWAHYFDPNTPSTSDIPGSCQSWQKITFNPVMPMMTETCDRPGPVSPAVMLPYAEAMIGALADIDADGWFDEAPTGMLAAQESGADTAAIAGAVIVSGALSVTEAGADTASASGNALVSGSLSATEQGADTAIIVGGNILAGYLAAQESGSDTAAASGAVVVSGALAASEAGADGFAASGSIGSSDVIGNVAALESGADSIVVSGVVVVSGSMAAAEAGSDTMQTDNGEWYPSSRTITVPSGRTITLRAR